MLFLENLNTEIEKCNNDDILILGGDFNCVEQNIDRNHVEPHMVSRKRLIQLIEYNELCDVWRSFNENVRQYTWLHHHDNLIISTIG